MKYDGYDVFNAAYDNDANSLRVCIVDNGVDPNAPHENAGHTPLQAACETDALNSILELLLLGANPNFRFTKISMVDGHVIGARNGVALMHVRSVAAADLLIRNGADASLIDEDGLTAKDWAISRGKIDLACFLEAPTTR